MMGEFRQLEQLERDLEADLRDLEDLNRRWDLLVAGEILSEVCAGGVDPAAVLGEDLKECCRRGWSSPSPSEKSLELVAETTRWRRLRSRRTPSESQTLCISESGEAVRRHRTRWVHLRRPEVRVLAEFNTEEDLSGEDGIRISNLNLAVEVGNDGDADDWPLLVPSSEVEPLVAGATRDDGAGRDLPDFFARLDLLVCAGERRRSILRQAGLPATSWAGLGDRGGRGFEVAFDDESTGCRMVTVHWDLVCRLDNVCSDLLLVDQLRFRFTPEGKRLAEECNLPEEVVAGDLFEGWTVEEHLKNLRKMVALR